MLKLKYWRATQDSGRKAVVGIMHNRIPAPALFLATGLIAAQRRVCVAGFLTFEDLLRLGSVGARHHSVQWRVCRWVETHSTSDCSDRQSWHRRNLRNHGPASWRLPLRDRLGLGDLALLAIALAPTDPAAAFLVLRGHTLRGRSYVALEGESGANDPVGIALMIGAIEYIVRDGTLAEVALEFLAALGIGLFVGLVLGALLRRIVSWVDFRNPYAQTLVMIAGALTTYATADLLTGSGFLAAFVAGLMVGDTSTRASVRAHFTLGIAATIAEMALFLAMGTSVTLHNTT